jgi:hypothetical protein
MLLTFVSRTHIIFRVSPIFRNLAVSMLKLNIYMRVTFSGVYFHDILDAACV